MKNTISVASYYTHIYEYDILCMIKYCAVVSIFILYISTNKLIYMIYHIISLHRKT